jgi:hypothetical protein
MLGLLALFPAASPLWVSAPFLSFLCEPSVRESSKAWGQTGSEAILQDLDNIVKTGLVLWVTLEPLEGFGYRNDEVCLRFKIIILMVGGEVTEKS